MQMDRDGNGHVYLDVRNIRITYIPQTNRRRNADWSESDVLRIQAYKGDESRALHRGAELPVPSPDALLEFIAALCTVYNGGLRT